MFLKQILTSLECCNTDNSNKKSSKKLYEVKKILPFVPLVFVYIYIGKTVATHWMHCTTVHVYIHLYFFCLKKKYISKK